MSEENNIENPFDKDIKTADPTEPQVAVENTETPVGAVVDAGTDKEEVVPADAIATGAEEASVAGPTPTSTDYSKYATMSETPDATERRKFDYVAVSGGVETEVITTDDGDVEKRKPAKAVRLLVTKERDVDDNLQSEELALPVTVVPIKYRTVMFQNTGAKGEVKVLKSSEFNGKQSDIVTVNRFSADGKIAETFGPMTVAAARKQFIDEATGRSVLRDRVNLYGFVNGGDTIEQFAVKGTGLWEKESELHKGKTEESRQKFPFLKNYISEFSATEPYFLYEMNVNAVYRDHGSIKYYRPTFTRGARISPEVEVEVLKNLEDLHKYFGEQDEAVKKFVADTTPVEEAPAADVPFGSDAEADGEY